MTARSLKLRVPKLPQIQDGSRPHDLNIPRFRDSASRYDPKQSDTEVAQPLSSPPFQIVEFSWTYSAGFRIRKFGRRGLFSGRALPSESTTCSNAGARCMWRQYIIKIAMKRHNPWKTFVSAYYVSCLPPFRYLFRAAYISGCTVTTTKQSGFL
ncbi:hypothetical protein K438DRAFT_1762517 [Mycena galopus ATCC 62051]|nr:hypothetical protein K438DRAFT_1762517 [Mycena galopus ATCC 62051]